MVASGMGHGDDSDFEQAFNVDATQAFRDKYEIKARIGKGLSSTVYQALDKTDGSLKAVKVMDITENHINADGMNIIQQVHEEIRLLKLVAGHRYIIELLDVYESQCYVFLVFKMLENDLFEHLSQNVSLSEKRCRAIMKQIFEAVHYCHKKKIIHRDIKPENILLDENLNVQLTDFGLAKEMTKKQRLFDCVGTPGYLAPEVLEAGMCADNSCLGYSFEVDAWACGVVMYTLLVGTPPFWHRDQLKMIRLIMTAKFSMDGPAWSAITSETKDLIRKLLVVDPRKRLTIEQALQHEVFHAQRYTRVGGELLCIVHEEDDEELANVNDVKPVEETRRTQSHNSPTHVPTINIVGPVVSAKRLVRRRTSTKVVAEAKFDARRMFRTAIYCVRSLVRILRIKVTVALLDIKMTRVDPYGVKQYRRTIDRDAFNLYAHWIKKDQGQDRAAFFQSKPKCDIVRRKKKSKDNTNNLLDVNSTAGCVTMAGQEA